MNFNEIKQTKVAYQIVFGAGDSRGELFDEEVYWDYEEAVRKATGWSKDWKAGVFIIEYRPSICIRIDKDKMPL